MMKLDRMTPDWLAVMAHGIVFQHDLFKPPHNLAMADIHRKHLHKSFQDVLALPSVKQFIDTKDDIGLRFQLDQEFKVIIGWQRQQFFDYQYVTTMHYYDLKTDELFLILTEPDTQEVLLSYRMKRGETL